MTENEKRASGLLFSPSDPELKEQKRKAHKLSADYNRLYEDETESRDKILKSLLGHIGVNTFLQGPITFHYGIHTTIGDQTFINFNFTVQDDASVSIGNHCDFGPNVTIVTPIHPFIASERLAIPMKSGEEKRLCYARDVVIQDNCWICANVVILPGVTIGEGCVIGAGSVVTRSIPPHSFAAGNPCRVIRSITEKDSILKKPELLNDDIDQSTFTNQ